MERALGHPGPAPAGALATVFAGRGETGGLGRRPLPAGRTAAGTAAGARPLRRSLRRGAGQGPGQRAARRPALRAGKGRTGPAGGTRPAAASPSGSSAPASIPGPIARLANELGWFVGVVDHRPALATPERFPEADRIVLGHPPASLQGLPLDRRSAALVVSHIYEKDLQALEVPAADAAWPTWACRATGCAATNCCKELGRRLTEGQRRALHFPAGLDIGAETPEAIALSMLAEVQAALAGHPGGTLRDRDGSIHG